MHTSNSEFTKKKNLVNYYTLNYNMWFQLCRKVCACMDLIRRNDVFLWYLGGLFPDRFINNDQRTLLFCSGTPQQLCPDGANLQ